MQRIINLGEVTNGKRKVLSHQNHMRECRSVENQIILPP
jgi:hypothetical protein